MRTSTFLVPTALLAAVSLSACAGRFSEESPPANAKPLSEIVKSLEDQGYKDVERIKFDDKAWVVDARQPGGKEIDLHVNPVTGQIIKKE
jgi:Peptidase propeptide and YPEB domain